MIRTHIRLSVLVPLAALLLALLPAVPPPLGPTQVQAAADPLSLAWSSTESDGTTSVAWGDVDGDGDLDLAAGGGWKPNRLYRNDGGVLTASAVWSSTVMGGSTASVAWGDVDGDGDLDLAVGNTGVDGAPNWLYRNDGGVLTAGTVWWSTERDSTYSVAWGDVDGDGDLDLAVGNYGQPNRLYRNDGGVLTASAVWSSTESDSTYSVAWGDVDGDGDLAVGNYNQPNRLYRNDNGVLTASAVWSSTASDPTTSVAWGDYDGDGDLDLAVGNYFHQPNRLYRNDDGVLTASAVWSSTGGSLTWSVAWGDVDGDGDLDLAVGNSSTLLYRNESGALMSTSATWSSTESASAQSIAWGDVDSDGDLDLAVGNNGQPNRVYYNEDGTLSTSVAWSSIESDNTTSIAWADVDGDGDLDLAVGNNGQPNRLYRNDGGMLTASAVWSSAESDSTRGIAWGDADGDGDLDLVVGNYHGPSRLYRNDQGVLTPSAVWSSTESDYTTSVAWGDVDGDHDLDLIVGNYYGPNRLYRNDEGVLTPSAVWSSTESDNTTSVAWGDYDGDGDLDLAVGNDSQPSRLYRNDGGVLTGSAVWFSTESGATTNVAWGDYDGDGDLDLAANTRLYRNDGGALTSGTVWSATGSDSPRSVAWGDYDADGDLDLVVGNDGQPIRVYRNGTISSSGLPNSLSTIAARRPGVVNNAAFYSTPEIQSSPLISIPYTLNDPAGAPVRQVRADYSLDGGGTWQTAQPAADSPASGLTTRPAPTYTRADRAMNWNDISSTGTPLTLGNEEVSAPILLGFDFPFFGSTVQRMWVSSNGWLTFSQPTESAYVNFCLPANPASGAFVPTDLVAPYWDNLDPSAGGQIYYQQVNAQTMVVQYTNVPQFNTPGSAYTFQVILRKSGSITFQYLTMTGESSATVGVQQRIGAQITSLQVSCDSVVASGSAFGFAPAGQTHTFIWDTSISGFFDRSDNVVVRLIAYPSLTTGRNGTPVFQHPYISATTFPFRVRKIRVRVVDSVGQPVANAFVLRRPAGATAPATAFTFGQIFATTDPGGYLISRGILAPGDTLTALAPVPIEASRPYSTSATLYTSNIISTTGSGDFTITSSGVQTVTVRPERPLLLFHLNISLEWDARSDTRYMAQLDAQIRRASDLLFDATNGQAALGDVFVWHDKENWDIAHVRVYASSRLRPSATLGGVSSEVFTRTLTVGGATRNLIAAPGQLQMGATWNRFGSVGDNLAEDWPRTLAHELGHYLFFLDDNYVGIDPSGRLSAVESCPGLMADPYASVELRPAVGWLPACEQTLSHHVSGRSDWETITDTPLYPFLQAPGGSFEMNGRGPVHLPLAVTTITFADPLTPTARLAAPYFYAKTGAGERVVPSAQASAYLFQDSWRDAEITDRDRVTPLGGATQDAIFARGARVGDRLCLFDPSAPLGASGAPLTAQGCTTITEGGETISLTHDPTWSPEVQVTPVTSMTLAVAVTLPTSYAGPGLAARIHPDIDSIDPITLTLARDANAPIYRGQVTLDAPVYEATVHLWTDIGEGDPARREAISSFSLGGSPDVLRNGRGVLRNGGGFLRSGGGVLRNGRGVLRNGRGVLRNGRTPLTSASGDVLIYGEDLAFDVGEYLVLQTVNTPPDPPLWATPVGQSYVLALSAGAPSLTGVEISFGYQGRDVPDGEEGGIRVYYQAPGTSIWEALPTALNNYYNLASAQVRGPGRYALMSSVEVPLDAAGWSMFAYPVAGQRAVADALAGIVGKYTAVYGYEPQDTTDHWKLFAPDGPTWANDLNALTYGRGYWIQATEAVTLPLRGATAQAPASLTQVPPAPPMTLYGIMPVGGTSAPTSGLPVTAKIGGVVCAETTTRAVGDKVGFALDVPTTGERVGCGSLDALVDVMIGGRRVGQVRWMSGPQPFVANGSSTRVLLPFVRR